MLAFNLKLSRSQHQKQQFPLPGGVLQRTDLSLLAKIPSDSCNKDIKSCNWLLDQEIGTSKISLKVILLLCNNKQNYIEKIMHWDIEYTDDFELWWESLNEAEHIDIAATVDLLEEYGSHLKFPYSSGITQSKHSHMQELPI